MTPECVNPPCDRDADVRVKPSPMGSKREFCTPCYQSWRRGAMVSFTQGIPKGEPIEVER